MNLLPCFNSLRQMSFWPTATQTGTAAAILAGASILYSAVPDNWKSYAGNLALEGVGFITSRLGLSPFLKQPPSPSNNTRAQARINRIQGHLTSIPQPSQPLQNNPTQSAAISNNENSQEKIYTFLVKNPENIQAIILTLSKWFDHLNTLIQELENSTTDDSDRDTKITIAKEAAECCNLLSHFLKNLLSTQDEEMGILVSVDSKKNLLACGLFHKDEKTKTFTGHRLVSNPFNHKILHPENPKQIRGAAANLLNHLRSSHLDWSLSLSPYQEVVSFYTSRDASVSEQGSFLVLKNTPNYKRRPNHVPLEVEPKIHVEGIEEQTNKPLKQEKTLSENNSPSDSNSNRAQTRMNRIGNQLTLKAQAPSIAQNPEPRESGKQEIYTFLTTKRENLENILSTLRTWSTDLKSYIEDLQTSHAPESLDRCMVAKEALDCCESLIYNLSRHLCFGWELPNILVAVDSYGKLLACGSFIKKEQKKVFEGQYLISNPANNSVLYPDSKKTTRGAADCLLNHLRPSYPGWQLKFSSNHGAFGFYKSRSAGIETSGYEVTLTNTHNYKDRSNHIRMDQELEIQAN